MLKFKDFFQDLYQPWLLFRLRVDWLSISFQVYHIVSYPFCRSPNISQKYCQQAVAYCTTSTLQARRQHDFVDATIRPLIEV